MHHLDGVCPFNGASAGVTIDASGKLRARSGLLRRLLFGGALALLPGSLLTLSAQEPQNTPATAQKANPQTAQHGASTPARSGHTSASHRHTGQHTQKPSAAKPAQEAAATPAAPPPPDWPANHHPNPATIVWDSHGLEIQASNSSLDQILHEVATETGAKLEGFNQDQRVFGNYGPGPARDVLSKLLDGSGYNVLMIGGAGDQPPQHIILSTSAAGTPPPPNTGAQSSDQQEDQDVPAEQNPEQNVEQNYGPPQYPMPPRGPFGGPQRTPQEIQQQMQQMQQQREQQQQQQQQGFPAPQQPQ